MDEERWVTLKDGRKIYINTNNYMNNKIRNESKKLTQSEQLKQINEKYKDKLMYPIRSYKVKDYWTGDRKTGKYHNEYHARTKNGYDIYSKSFEELEEQLKKEIYK